MEKTEKTSVEFKGYKFIVDPETMDIEMRDGADNMCLVMEIPPQRDLDQLQIMLDFIKEKKIFSKI